MIPSPDSGRVELDWVRPQDDADIRLLLQELAMDGDIRLALARDPSYADALCVEGAAHDVLVGRDQASGRVAGLGTRSVKPAYVNGVASTVGYLGGLRAHPEYRNGRDFFRAYQMMHSAHRACPAPYTLTTILEENRRALRLLTSGRMGLPVYHDFGQLHTLCYAPRPIRHAGVRRATPADAEAILALVHHFGPLRQFYPCYQAADVGPGGGLLRDLAWTDMLLAEADGIPTGCMGVWDQRAFRQTILNGYSPRFRAARPVWNLLAPVHRRPRLPDSGRRINHRVVAAVGLARDDPGVFRQLLRAAVSLAADQGAEQLAIGLHERDPLLGVARSLAHFPIRSRLYLVGWPEDDDPRPHLDDRPPYLELGGL